jgi:hypothetical protein
MKLNSPNYTHSRLIFLADFSTIRSIFIIFLLVRFNTRTLHSNHCILSVSLNYITYYQVNMIKI